MSKVSICAYCEECDRDVEFNIVSKIEEVVVRGVPVTYENKRAFCKHCGKEVFPVSYGKESFISLMDAYKKKVNLLTSEEIKDILRKRGLTQKKLANLLCIGEKDITRYLQGSVQSKSVDNMLRFIRDDIVYKRIKVILANQL